ncbi:MAG: ATP synthase F1 subunit gamma [Rickettsiales bacterium]|nr:ATP synthase F1 subunit gamma [Rickettsiales bacterium]
MTSLKSLKTRKTTVKAIEKVTHAMKLVSASKLRKARDDVEKSRFYMKVINEILHRLSKKILEEDSNNIDQDFPLLLGNKDPQKYLLIIIGSDRGLCGAFNNNIIKEAIANTARLLKENKKPSILCIGERIYRAMKEFKELEVTQFCQPLKTSEEIKEFAQNIITKFYKNEFDVCELYYTEFVSPIVQTVTSKTLIPLLKVIENKLVTADDTLEEEETFECEPNKVSLLKDLVTQILDDSVISIFQDALASEHGARMTAMDNATRNANEMIDLLTSEYNKKRQAAITTELVEIISGAEAINQQ